MVSNKHRAWDRELKRHLFETLGIEWCESCGTSYGLTVMHSMKRRFIQTKEDYFQAAVVCLREHQSYDEGVGENVHERMKEFVDGLVAKRST